MLSYHNDNQVKQKYIERFNAHRAADEVIQSTGFEDGRGCFVGCTLDNYDHSRFPIELGWPEWLAYLADQIFEGLPKEECAQFGSDLLESVPVGVDLEPVRHLVAIERLNRLIELQSKNTRYDTAQVIEALNMVKRCHEADLKKEHCDWSAANSALESAVWSAARSAAWSSELSSEWSPAYQKERDTLLNVLRGL